MQQWRDTGIILTVRPYGEAAAIARLLTREHGLHAGYVHSAQRSGRLRSILEQGNIVNADWSSKSGEDSLGAYQLELEQPIGPYVFEEPLKLLAVQSLCQILDIAAPEREVHEALFDSSFAFVTSLENKHFMAMYVVWEITMLNALGFGLDLTRCVATGQTEGLDYVSPKSGCAVSAQAGEDYKDKLFRMPSFLKGEGDDSASELAEGLKITGHFLQKQVFDPVYKKLPMAREQLYNKICEQIMESS
jgi:DNA repair protein RecO (recombination protein O)